MHCKNCGNQLKEGSKFCPQCGTTITAPEPVVRAKPATKPRIQPRVVGVVFAGIVLAFGLTTFFREIMREAHPVISAQPVVSEPIDYTNARIEMVDIPSRVENGKIIFSLDDVRRYRLVRIHYKGRLIDVPVLAYISGEGKLVTAISRSEPSNATTFSIEGTTIKSDNCAANWELDNLKPNACCPRYPPDPIPSVVVGNEVHIEEKVVANWKSRL